MISDFMRRIAAGAAIVVLIGCAFLAGLYFGSYRTLAVSNSSEQIGNNNSELPGSADFAPFWKAWNILNEKYVPTKKSATTTDQDKVWGAIKGLAESYGDPYTTFFPPQESKDFQDEISGNFEGVGMEVGMKDGVVTVISPLKNTPAYKAGVKPGDAILKIDDTVTSNLSVDDAIKLIRGKKGTTVRLTLLSANAKEPHEVKVIRDTIDIPTIDTIARKDGIFVIQLYNFSANSAVDFRGALQKFVNSGGNKLVLDLRGNPGGYLEAAVDMASWFLSKDKIVVQEDNGGKSENTVLRSKGYNIFSSNLKMMILVDGGSASASEILAGALQENGVAKLVGTKTYGKGSVQELVDLTPDTSLKVTIARWLTPKGNSISEQGLAPDYAVQMTQKDADAGKDPQMDKAIQLLQAK